jgi:2-C-methyl-D-erythritol 2,4-cyclodiphosphate synthase
VPADFKTATTEEKLGFTGTEQGISAYAVAGLERV